MNLHRTRICDYNNSNPVHVPKIRRPSRHVCPACGAYSSWRIRPLTHPIAGTTRTWRPPATASHLTRSLGVPLAASDEYTISAVFRMQSSGYKPCVCSQCEFCCISHVKQWYKPYLRDRLQPSALCCKDPPTLHACLSWLWGLLIMA